MKKVIVDLYGADAGPDVVINGVEKALNEDEELSIILVGEEKYINSILEKNYSSRLEIINTSEYVTNSDQPMLVFKDKENASMVKGLKLLAEDKTIDGIVSCGNTGALLIGSIFKVGMFGDMKCPALSCQLPCKDEDKYVCLLDCGANVDCKPEDLVDYAVLGSVFMSAMYKIDKPKVGLLSVGTEDSKGNILTKSAFSLIKKQTLNFVGNVEATALSEGKVDVMVCDGFNGNIILKSLEAVGKLAMSIVENEMQSDCRSDAKNKLAEVRGNLFKKFDFNSQGGATFLGVKKIVVKAHGNANVNTIYSCINQVATLSKKGFISRLDEAFSVKK